MRHCTIALNCTKVYTRGFAWWGVLPESAPTVGQRKGAAAGTSHDSCSNSYSVICYNTRPRPCVCIRIKGSFKKTRIIIFKLKRIWTVNNVVHCRDTIVLQIGSDDLIFVFWRLAGVRWKIPIPPRNYCGWRKMDRDLIFCVRNSTRFVKWIKIRFISVILASWDISRCPIIVQVLILGGVDFARFGSDKF